MRISISLIYLIISTINEIIKDFFFNGWSDSAKGITRNLIIKKAIVQWIMFIWVSTALSNLIRLIPEDLIFQKYIHWIIFNEYYS